MASNVCQAPPSQYLDGASGKRGGRRAASCLAHSARNDTVTGTSWSSPATAAASAATARVGTLGNGCGCIENLRGDGGWSRLTLAFWTRGAAAAATTEGEQKRVAVVASRPCLQPRRRSIGRVFVKVFDHAVKAKSRSPALKPDFRIAGHIP